MSKISRRSFVGLMTASTAALSMPYIAFGAAPRVVVIGGGAGGADEHQVVGQIIMAIV